MTNHEDEEIPEYQSYIKYPMKFGGILDWYQKPKTVNQMMFNYIYLSLLFFIEINISIMLFVYLYTEWTDILTNLSTLADVCPFITSVILLVYSAMYRDKIEDLFDYVNREFKYHSARGLTNMTMKKTYWTAKRCYQFYTFLNIFTVTTYTLLPLFRSLLFDVPLQGWFIMDVYGPPYDQITLLRVWFAEVAMALSIGQLTLVFASGSMLLTGQLDVICCSIRNARYTALMKLGVAHGALAATYRTIVEDERHSYTCNKAHMVDSRYHYDQRVSSDFTRVDWDIYSKEFDEATEDAIKECAKLYQVSVEYKNKLEEFMSPVLVVRVIQVTLYLCTLLYAVNQKMDMAALDYMIAVILDFFVYCYLGNQFIVQADRVATAAYQAAWPTMSARPRRLLLNFMLSNKRSMAIRAGYFLPIDLRTFLSIIKTSFSYYTLLAHVNEHK